MKILILKKKLIINILFYALSFFFIIILVYCTFNNYRVLKTISPINTSHDIQGDLTGDGVKDSIELLNSQNKFDFSISCSNENYRLSSALPDKTLFSNDLKPKIFLHDISRDNIPEIILLGSKYNKCKNYVFHWNKKNFTSIYSSENNILGILDSKNSHTPQCYSLSLEQGISSLNSFMLINDSPLDTTKDNTTIPSLDSVTNFINIIKLPYVLDELPDIFESSIDKDNLSLLWNLDKDNYSYAFKYAFFYDYRWNEFGEPSAIRWRLSFEKQNSKMPHNISDELVFLIDLVKDNTSYKINAIQRAK